MEDTFLWNAMYISLASDHFNDTNTGYLVLGTVLDAALSWVFHLVMRILLFVRAP